MNWKKIGLVSALSAVLGSSAYANLVINPTWDSTITSDGNAAQIQATINQAIAFYNTNFTDNITVEITFKKGGGLGSSNTGFVFDTYTNFRAALAADSSTADDTLALSFLPGGATNPVSGGTEVAFSRANAKALGYSIGAGADGVITLNTNICNLVHGTNTNSSFYDLYAVTCHEIDEVLGTIALVEDPFGSGRSSSADMYRYNNGSRSWDTSNTHAAFFSIDGTNNIVEYNQNGRTGGDWGDWIHHNGSPMVQDWSGTPGVTIDMSSAETRLLDVVGYNKSSAVPEPASLAVLGFGVLVMARRRKKA